MNCKWKACGSRSRLFTCLQFVATDTWLGEGNKDQFDILVKQDLPPTLPTKGYELLFKPELRRCAITPVWKKTKYGLFQCGCCPSKIKKTLPCNTDTSIWFNISMNPSKHRPVSLFISSVQAGHDASTPCNRRQWASNPATPAKLMAKLMAKLNSKPILWQDRGFCNSLGVYARP